MGGPCSLSKLLMMRTAFQFHSAGVHTFISRWGIRRTVRAFTLLELIIVVAIVSLLVSLSFPALSHARESARRIQCMGSMRQLYLAQVAWAEDNNGWFFYDVVEMGAPAWAAPAQTGHYEPLQPYLVKTDPLYCASALKRDIQSSAAPGLHSNLVKPWGNTFESIVHYGYVGYLGNWMDAQTILMFERPTFAYLGRGSADTSTTGGSIYLSLGQVSVYAADQTTPVVLPGFGVGVATQTAHGSKTGSNLLYVDGHVEWHPGGKIGPFYGHVDVPPEIGPPAATPYARLSF